jgi:uncharacterized protein
MKNTCKFFLLIISALLLIPAEALTESTQRARGELAYPQPRTPWFGLNGYPIFARFTGYQPAVQFKANDKVALQIVIAENEEYSTNPGAIQTYENHLGEKNWVIIPGIQHYGIYTTARQQSQELALAWCDRFLKESKR